MSISIKRITLMLSVMAAGLVWSGLPFLHAQDAPEAREGIGISPTSLTLDARAGETIQGELTILNPGEKPIEYRLYASSFRVRNESYDKDFDVNDPELAEPIGWFELPEENRQLEPKGQEKIPYAITVPEGTASQGYYGVIFAETVAGEVDETGIERRKRVGSLVYLTVNGADVRRSGKILSFEVPRWQKQPPVTADLRLRNDGNVHYAATGKVRLKNVTGRTIHEADISSTILPGTTRKISVQLPGAKSMGLYKVEGGVDFLDQSHTFGSRWVLLISPLWLGVWLAGLVLLLIVLILLGRRRRGRTS